MSVQVTEVTTGVHRVRDGLVNWYILEDGGGLTLVDTGWPRSMSGVREATRSLGRTPDDVRAALITHGHPDHLGTAEMLRRDHGVTVYAHAAETDRIRGVAEGSSPFALVPGLLPHLRSRHAIGFVLHASARGFMNPTWVQEVAPAVDGAVFDVPGRPRLVHTPGHTTGHAAYVVDGSGVVLTGDALVTLDPLSRQTGPRMLPDVFHSDPDQARASLDRLAGLDVRLLLPGHGEPYEGRAPDAVAAARRTG